METNEIKNSEYKGKIAECRKSIDDVDAKLVELFTERMRLSEIVHKIKSEYGVQTFDGSREREKLLSVTGMVDESLETYVYALYNMIIELSSSYQNSLKNNNNELRRTIREASQNTDKVFPQRSIVACQGIEGAYSQIAAERLFRLPQISFVRSFENVFAAVNSGMCRYGVIPLENSTAGSVNEIYDLMIEHKFKIVKSVRVKIDHNLLGINGAKKEDIRVVYSHEQAIDQCEEYLKSLGDVEVHVCANTAVAAKTVAELNRKDTAALSSEMCASVYGLSSIEQCVQDRDNNYTRFICISKELEIYPGADRTSIMMVLQHKPGALYKVLARFFALGINLVKLESRPMPEREFEFMFYFDLETSVYSDEFSNLIGELDELCAEFRYLGSYSELV